MDDEEFERKDRILLRPWLENMLESGSIPGLDWFSEDKTMFKIAWKHRSKKDWSMRHSGVFLEWAKNTGRWSEGDPPPNFAQLKTRLRCAFNKAPDIEEMKDFHVRKGEEPYKVYKFYARKAKLAPVKSFSKTFTTTNARVLHQWSESPPPGGDVNNCVEELAPFDEEKYYTEDEVRLNSPRPSSIRNRPRENMYIQSPVARIKKDVIRSAASSSRDIQSTSSFSALTSNIPISVEQMTSCSSSDSDSNESPRTSHHSKKASKSTSDDFSTRTYYSEEKNTSYYPMLGRDVISGNVIEGVVPQSTEHWVGDPRTNRVMEQWSQDQQMGFVPSMPDIVPPHSLASSRSSIAEAVLERNDSSAAPSPGESRLYLLGVASMIVEEVDRKRLEMEDAVRLSNCTTPVGEASQMTDSPSITEASPYYQTVNHSDGMQLVEANNLLTGEDQRTWEYSPEEAGFNYATTPTQMSENSTADTDINTLRREYKEKEQLLVIKAKTLLKEEERLQAWEKDLLNKQEELNRRELFLESAMKAKSNGMEDFRNVGSVRANVYGDHDTNSTANCESLLSRDCTLSEKGTDSVAECNVKQNLMEYSSIQFVRQSVAMSAATTQARNLGPAPMVSRPRLVAKVIRANSMNLGVRPPRVSVSESLGVGVSGTSSSSVIPTKGRPPLILERSSFKPREMNSMPQMPFKESKAVVSSLDGLATLLQRPLRSQSNLTANENAPNRLTLSVANIRPNVNLSVSGVPSTLSYANVDNKNDPEQERASDSVGSIKFVTAKTKEKKAVQATAVKSIIVHPFRHVSVSPQSGAPTATSAVYCISKSTYPFKGMSGEVSSSHSGFDSSLRNEKINGSSDDTYNQLGSGVTTVADLDVRVHDAISRERNPKEVDSTANRTFDDSRKCSDDSILSNVKEFVSRVDEVRRSSVSLSPANENFELTKIMDVTSAANSATGRSSFTDWLREKTEKICNRDVCHDASSAIISAANFVGPKETHVVLTKSPVKTCSSPVKHLIREKLGCALTPTLESTLVRIESNHVKTKDSRSPIAEMSSKSILTPEIASLTLGCGDTRNEEGCRSTNNDFTESPAFNRFPAVILNSFLSLVDPILVTGFKFLFERTLTLWKTSLALDEARTIDEGASCDSTSNESCEDAKLTFDGDDDDVTLCFRDRVNEHFKLKPDRTGELSESVSDWSDHQSDSHRLESKSYGDEKSRPGSPSSSNSSRKRRLSDKVDDTSSKLKFDIHAIGGRQ